MDSRVGIRHGILSDALFDFFEPLRDATWSGSRSASVLIQPDLNLGGFHWEAPVPSDDPFYTVIGNTIQGSYFPASSTGTTTDPTNPGSVLAATSGGATINLIFDAAAMAAPTSFRSGVQEAAAILAANITDKITLNLKIDYSGIGGGAAAGPDNGYYESYSWVRSNLLTHSSAGDTTFNSLANVSSLQGQSSVAVWNAQLKLWGVLGANDTTTDDGSATFATDINPNLLVGVALHELTHAMGRVPYGSAPDVFDLFRFTSPGVHLFQGGATAPAAYFSVDGGNTKLADYGQQSDPSDFLNSGVQGPNDPFNEYYTSKTSQQLSAIDLKQLDALGFHLVQSSTSSAPATVANVHANDLTYASTASGANHFIDLQNFEASFPDLVHGFGSNTPAMQNWYNTYEPTEQRVETFDGLDYIASYGDLISAFQVGSMQGIEHTGASHYISFGFNEGRATTFNGLDYVASYSDLIKAYGVNSDAGAFHFIEYGSQEGRTVTFDGLNYIASYPDLIKAFGANEQAGAAHFIGHGAAEGRATTFDGLSYIAQYPDLMKSFGANNDAGAVHYIDNGFAEGRSTAFKVAAYEQAHPDLVGAYATTDQFLAAYINHFVSTGQYLV
ncbi:hypothetical protein ABIC09_004580 [Bradyrhizobium sp. S3.12.5]|uniref:NF038122 family metalloprotease n=1 Tax=Bradyrhizobium sp. S3.12.5 TaxID=3156386 RepID=UPI00339A231C